jgi:hypothetical protein
VAVSFGQLTHQDKHRFKENGLAKRIRQRIHSSSAQAPETINKGADDITKDSADESENEKPRNNADKLEQGRNSRTNN